MLEVKYATEDNSTLMYVPKGHRFFTVNQQWIKAEELTIGCELCLRSGAVARISSVLSIDPRYHYCDVKLSHNHHFFVTDNPKSAQDVNCIEAPTDPLELIPYELANKPSYFPNGEPTGHHSGPWVAAQFVDDSKISISPVNDIVGWGRADENRCAEDAAVADLLSKMPKGIILHQGNVRISHAYVRKYTKKGRLINTMSPCCYCHDNYGRSLNDQTIGDSDVIKLGRSFLAKCDNDEL